MFKEMQIVKTDPIIVESINRPVSIEEQEKANKELINTHIYTRPI